MFHDVVSLITVLDGILHVTDQEDQNHQKALFESLLEKATALMNLLEESVTRHHLRGNREIIEAFPSEIRDAAHEAEDIVESHAVDQMLYESDDSTTFISSLLEVMEKFDAAKDKLMKIIMDDQSHEAETTDVIINPPSFVEADTASSGPNIAVVGFDEDAIHLKDRLTSRRRQREIIPIVGMGGIGKTTLARNLYNDRLIVSHFDARAWVTVSQDYNVRAILLGLLGCLFEKISDDVLRLNDSDLGLTLYQRLCGRRYLLVLDDIWRKNAWDEIKSCFPNQYNGSRILIASRELDVAKYPDSACKEHPMHLLSHTQSWDLLRQKVFDVKKEERCPPSLEEIGHKIAGDCRGLPLAISVMGGLLSANKYSKDLWEQVAKDVRSVLSHRDEHFSKILSLSYDNLPLHLKPCFLYMAAFPEDFEVKGSRLVKLWVAEGFLRRPNGNNKSLEDVGEEYLKALVDRNLLSVADTYYVGRANSYTMHDLLRDLCIRKDDDEKFISIFNNEEFLQDSLFGNPQRMSVYKFGIGSPDYAESVSCSRSFLWLNDRYCFITIYDVLPYLRLVRVLDMYDIEFDEFPTEIIQLVNLRFLAVNLYRTSLPSGIWRLRNLQILIVWISDARIVRLPYEAWEISGLRHIVLKGDASISIDFKVPFIQKRYKQSPA